MKHKRTGFLCSLLLISSLSACAPTLIAPSGENYKPDVKIGLQMLVVERVSLAELNEFTPSNVYVKFPNCDRAVVSVIDVRKLGSEKATEICNSSLESYNGGVNAIGNIALILSVPAVVILFYLLSLISPDF